MKKTYILPEIQIVHLTPANSMLQLSARLSNADGDQLMSSDEIGTKEEYWDDDLWDDE